MTWKPDWELPPEPAGDDEDAARELYEREMRNPPNSTWVRFYLGPPTPWNDLQEWQREAWRRELRDG